MGVVVAQKTVGHSRGAGELRGLVGEPERLLSPADCAALAGLRVELSSADPEQQDCHRDECGEARLQAA